MRGNKSNDRLIIILGLFAIFTVHSCGPISPEDDAASDNAGAISGGVGTADDETRGGIDRHDRDDLEDEAADSDDEDRTDGMMPVAGHTVDLSGTGILHASGFEDPVNNCTACHGADLLGAGAAPSCLACHGRVWESEDGQPSGHDVPLGATETLHRAGLYDPLANCTACHGADLLGNGGIPSCTQCHGPLWLTAGPPFDHTVPLGNPEVFHRSGLTAPESNCSVCHGALLSGTASAPSCTLCHGALWEIAGIVPADHTVPQGQSGILHRAGFGDPQTNCTACHGAQLQGAGTAPSCTQCHGELWGDGAGPPSDHVLGLGDPLVLHRAGLAEPQSNCTACHGGDLGGAGAVPSCTLCHSAIWESAGGPPASHTVAQGAMGILHQPGFDDPTVNCTACHGADLSGAGVVPSCTLCHGPLWDGGDISGSHDIAVGNPAVLHRDGLYDPLANCTTCHGVALNGTSGVPACWVCHGSIWDAAPDYPPDHTISKDGDHHAPGLESPTGQCDACHGADLTGTPLIPSCTLCHGVKWDEVDDDSDDD